MCKLIIFLVTGMLWYNVGFADTIKQRLDDIEKRLEKIEDSLSGLDLINNLLQKDTISSNKTTNESKLEFYITKLYCEEENYFNKVKIAYKIQNNYDKEVKLVDAHVLVKDLFDETIFKGKIAKDVYLQPNTGKTTRGAFDDMLSNHCQKIGSTKFQDLKYELIVEKIAFGDNSILEF